MKIHILALKILEVVAIFTGDGECSSNGYGYGYSTDVSPPLSNLGDLEVRVWQSVHCPSNLYVNNYGYKCWTGDCTRYWNSGKWLNNTQHNQAEPGTGKPCNNSVP
jgi:hypothetical protein